MMKNKNCLYILNVPFTRLSKNELLLELEQELKGSKKKFLATPNPEMLLETEKNPDFKTILNHTDYNIPDGIGILWAAHFLWWTSESQSSFQIIIKAFLSLLKLLFHPQAIRNQLPERLTGTDLMRELCVNPHFSPYPVFFLGGEEGIAEKASKKLQALQPHLKIAGTYSGSPDDKKAIHLINQSKAEILFVAFGAPKQEFWLKKNFEQLSGVKLAVGVGGAFDFFAEKRKRAPLFMQKFALEWLFRLIQEPRRIKRIFNAVIRFPLYIIQNQLKQKNKRRSNVFN